MPVLKWNEHDLVEALGVLPQRDEFFASHTFSKVFGSIRLELTIYPFESLVALSIFDSTAMPPFLDLSFIVRDQIVLNTEKEYSSLVFHDAVIVSNQFWQSEPEDKRAWFDRSTTATDLSVELVAYPSFAIRIG
jgi:hypothetical protein